MARKTLNLLGHNRLDMVPLVGTCQLLLISLSTFPSTNTHVSSLKIPKDFKIIFIAEALEAKRMYECMVEYFMYLPLSRINTFHS